MHIDDMPDMLTVEEVANYLRISKWDAYNKLPKLPGFPIIKLSERRTRIPKKALLAWLEQQVPGTF